jgi:chorismate mutase
MNTDHDITKFIITLGELFPGTVSEVKARVYLNLLREDLRNQDLAKLLEHLAGRFKFMPSIAEIKEHIGTKTQTRRELATEFVDTMLGVLQSNHNFYEYVGSDNARFWKETVNITKADLQHLEPQFHRTHWIDCVERAYLKFDQNVLKFEKKSVAELLSMAPKGGSDEGA